MQKVKVLLPISLAVLTMGLMFLYAGEEQRSKAVGQEPASVEMGTRAMMLRSTILGQNIGVLKQRQTPASAYSLAAADETITYTVSLPLIVRNHPSDDFSPFGIVMYGRVDNVGGLDLMKEAGSKWVTTHFVWSLAEPSNDQFNWVYADRKAQNAQAAGLDLFILFSDNPDWAAELPGGPVNDMQDLLDVASRMAERYDCDGVSDAEGHPCVHNWSFYPEPDNANLPRAKKGKGYWGHNGAEYADMISQVSEAMRSADPQARVFIGGLAYDWFEEDGGIFVRSFLPDTLDALNARGGAGKYIDGVTFHFYPINGEEWPTIAAKAAELRSVMNAHGAGSLPLIVPEMGNWSSPTFGSSEAAQAQRLVQMYVRGLSQEIELMSWYKVFDVAVAGSADDTARDKTSGLLRVDRSKKPSYYAYQTMTRELEGWIYQRVLGAAGAEGYVFKRPGNPEKTVLWSNAGTTRVTFPYTRLRLVTVNGQEFDIRDNDPGPPGDLDGGIVGQIELAIYENQPVYVEPK